MSARVTYAWLLVCTFVIYGWWVDIKPYADDFQVIFLEPSLHVFRHFHDPVAPLSFYRPLQNAVLESIQYVAGGVGWPVHGLQIVLHGVLAVLVYTVIRGLEGTRNQAMLGALFMVVSQANTHAVLSFDTLSQVCATLFGYVSLWLLFRAVTLEDMRRRRLLGGYVALTLALLSKETAVAFLPMLLVVLVAGLWKGRLKPSLAAAMRPWLPACLITGAYAILWIAVMGHVPVEGRYDMNLGLNIGRSAVLFGAAMSVPLPSPVVFAWLQHGVAAGLVLAGAGAMIFLGIVGGGLAGSRLGRLGALLLALVTLSLLPVVALSKVSELYVYGAMPGVAVATGLGAGHLLAPGHGPSRWSVRRVLLQVLGAAILLGHILSVQVKANLMAENGESAARLLEEVSAAVDDAKADIVYLVQPDPDALAYSVYYMPGFSVLAFAEPLLRYRSGRPELRVQIVDRVQIEGQHAAKVSVQLGLCTDRRRVCRLDGPRGRKTAP